MLRNFSFSKTTTTTTAQQQQLQNNPATSGVDSAITIAEQPSPVLLERTDSSSSIIENYSYIALFTRFFQFDTVHWRAMLGVPSLIATIGKEI